MNRGNEAKKNKTVLSQEAQNEETVLSQEAHSTAVDEHIEKMQAFMTS